MEEIESRDQDDGDTPEERETFDHDEEDEDNGEEDLIDGDQETVEEPFPCVWRQINPPVNESDLNDVFAFSSSDVVAVGDNGTILRFDGADWQEYESGTDCDLLGVGGSDPNHLTAVGMGGCITRWNGAAWETVLSPVDLDLFAVDERCFLPLIVGRGGTILKWSGGRWTRMESGTDRDLRGVWCPDSATAYVVGDGSTILKYVQGAWTPFDNSGIVDDLIGIASTEADGLFVLGRNGVWRRDGNEWREVVTLRDSGFVDIAATNDVYLAGIERDLVEVQGFVLKYEAGIDDGVFTRYGTHRFQVNALSVPRGHDPIVVGDRGFAATERDGSKPIDRGNKWGGIEPYDIWGIGPDYVLIVGLGVGFDASSSDVMEAGIVQTDGRLISDYTLFWLTRYAFTIWGTSKTDLYLGGGGIWRWDPRRDWVMVYQPSGWIRIRGLPDRFAVAVGESQWSDGYVTEVAFHEGGGDDEWSAGPPVPGLCLTDVWVGSRSCIYLAGSKSNCSSGELTGGGRVARYDGRSWQMADLSALTEGVQAIWGLDCANVWAVARGGLLHFDGSVWNMTETPVALRDVDGIATGSAFAVGPGGAVMHLGGNGWRSMPSGTTRDLSLVWASPDGGAFAAGNGGTILHCRP